MNISETSYARVKLSKIRIVHIQVIPKLSGVQLFSLNLLSGLPDSIYDKYVVFSSSEAVLEKQKKEIIERFSTENIKIIWVSHLKRSIGLSDIFSFFEFYSLFKKYKFDIVNTNSTKPGIVARIAARLAGIPNVIHTVHGIAFHKNEAFLKRCIYYSIEFFSSLFSNYIVSVNRYYLKYYNWIPFCKASTIYNGVKFPRVAVKRSIDSELDLSKKVVKLLFVGRLDAQKDPLTLLRAFDILVNQLNKDKINFILNVVGDGEYLTRCKEFCIEKKIHDSVIFHGWSTNTSLHYSQADLFVSSSVYEAFGFTLVEAAYHGLPIVATNVEGIPEVVIHNKMGLLVEPSEPLFLAAAIHFLSSHPELMSLYSKFGRESVCSRFQVKDMIDSYRNLYEG